MRITENSDITNNWNLIAWETAVSNAHQVCYKFSREEITILRRILYYFYPIYTKCKKVEIFF